MGTEKFLELLETFYSEVPDTGFAVKFYAQATSFSFEVHDLDMLCFTQESCVSQSEIYSWWIGEGREEQRREIIDDILEAVNRAKIKKTLKQVIEN